MATNSSPDMATLAAAKAFTRETALGQGAVQGPPGPQGIPGKQIEIQRGAAAIQWRYAGETAWTDLIMIADITGETGQKGETGETGQRGADGETPQFRLDGNTLQYRFPAAVPNDWTDLYTFPKTGTYTHNQTYASATWLIQHNLGGQPVTILAVDDTGGQIIGQRDIQASTNNLLVYRFSEPIAGTAYIKF